MQLTPTNDYNLCEEGFDIYVQIQARNIDSNHAPTIHEVSLKCECNEVTGRVPCTVYYFPPN